MDIHDAIEEYLGAKQNSVTHDTYKWYEHFLIVFDRWCSEQGITELTQIRALTVQRAISEHPRTNTYTRHGYAQVVKGFLSWCAKEEDLGVKESTVKRIELPKVEQEEITIFTDAEIMRLFRTCEGMRHPHRSKALVHMLLDTGVRAAELCYDGVRPNEETGLRMENLVLGKGGESYIWVMGKGRKPRTIGLGNETRIAVQRYLLRERGRSECPYVFLAQGDEPLSVRMLQQFLEHLGGLADVQGVHAHRFRHTFAVKQLMSGTSDIVLMNLMGHTTLDSTKIYTRAMTQLQARKAAPSVVDGLGKRGPGRGRGR